MKRRVHEEEVGGELNLVPYLDVVTNLVMFILLSMVGLFSLGVLDVGTPSLGEPPTALLSSERPSEPARVLTLGISARGFHVTGVEDVVADSGEAGVFDPAQPPTVPLAAGGYDYAALGALMARVKRAHPKEQRLILVAEMSVPYEVVIKTMDACRELTVADAGGAAPRTTLFPEVWLSMLEERR